jgi:hypothetical protein
MTSSVIQWDDDWFSVGEEGKKDPPPSAVQEPQDPPPSAVQEPQDQAPPPEEDWKWRIEVLEALVQQQVEKIEALEKEVQILKDRPAPPVPPAPAPSSPIMSCVSIAQLLEEWKQVKQRELNYALRRGQPVPFLSVESWLKWEQVTGSKSVLASKGSPLFRHQVMKEWEKEREVKEKEEKEMEALMRGLDAIKL